MFDEEDFDRMVDYVDYFSLMTYDYSSPQRPGPNSPIQWVKKCVEILDPKNYHRSQILLGLNFYGYDYTSEGGSPMVRFLQEHILRYCHTMCILKLTIAFIIRLGTNSSKF